MVYNEETLIWEFFSFFQTNRGMGLGHRCLPNVLSFEVTGRRDGYDVSKVARQSVS